MPASSKRKRLTKSIVERLPVGGMAWDAELPGFAARRLETGVSFILKYRTAQGRQRWYTVGRFGALTVEQARKNAIGLRGEIANQGDPQQKKTSSRERDGSDSTLASVVDLFMARHGDKLRTAYEYRRVFHREVVPKLGKKPIAEIGKHEIINLLERKAVTAPVQARHVYSKLRRLFSWAVKRGIIAASPMAAMEPPAEMPERDRVLSDDELRMVVAAIQERGWPFTGALMVLLLTLQRRNEVAGMRWSELALEGDNPTWTIPAERSKNGKSHLVPLSRPVVAILQNVPKVEGCDFVFTTTGTSVVSGFSRPKIAIDAHVHELRKKAAKLVRKDPDGIEPLPRWTYHDFRRTGVTILAERKGFPPHVVDKLLNHVPTSLKGVARIYNRAEYLDERRSALNAWAEHVAGLDSLKTRI